MMQLARLTRTGSPGVAVIQPRGALISSGVAGSSIVVAAMPQ
jgi:hypothetical protein